VHGTPRRGFCDAYCFELFLNQNIFVSAVPVNRAKTQDLHLIRKTMSLPQPELPEPAHPTIDSMLSRKFGKEVANYFSGILYTPMSLLPD
jgi:hypothetical protein